MNLTFELISVAVREEPLSCCHFPSTEPLLLSHDPSPRVQSFTAVPLLPSRRSLFCRSHELFTLQILWGVLLLSSGPAAHTEQVECSLLPWLNGEVWRLGGTPGHLGSAQAEWLHRLLRASWVSLPVSGSHALPSIVGPIQLKASLHREPLPREPPQLLENKILLVSQRSQDPFLPVPQ